MSPSKTQRASSTCYFYQCLDTAATEDDGPSGSSLSDEQFSCKVLASHDEEASVELFPLIAAVESDCGCPPSRTTRCPRGDGDSLQPGVAGLSHQYTATVGAVSTFRMCTVLQILRPLKCVDSVNSVNSVDSVNSVRVVRLIKYIIDIDSSSPKEHIAILFCIVVKTENQC